MRILTFKNVYDINRGICADEGIECIVLNQDNIESALSVFNSYFENDELVASALFRSIIINHGFQNGNKRTAVACLYRTLPPNISDVDLYKLTIDVASGQISDVYEIANILFGE